MHEHNEILVALVGQPNSGKSTIFNHLTGLHQTIANYPGVTVTKKSGHYHDGERRLEVVDLPGTYSLTSYSQEERVTRDFLLVERPEVVVAVVDATNLRRHLYFVFQLLELRVPLLICLNMSDIARRRGIVIDIPALERELGVPVVPTCGRAGEGLEELRQKINEISALHDHEPKTWQINYGPLEPLLENFEQALSQKALLIKDFSPRWLALKLLENDREARRIIQHHTHDKDCESLLAACAKHAGDYEKQGGDSPRKTIAACRNEKAQKIEHITVNRPVVYKRRSDTLDRFLCHPIMGLFGVALIMFLTFQLAFNVSDGWKWFPWLDGHGEFILKTPVSVCEAAFQEAPKAFMDATLHLPEGDLKSLIYNGIIDGVSGILVFVPVIFFLFLFISALEQSGYMARVVVVLDRLMRLFGLHGQSVLPMILGGGIAGGCAVPAVMATRTMREPRERLLTILVIPIMNCGAKIPVYALLIAAFFTAYRGTMMLAIILLSWGLALISALVLGKTFVKGPPTPLIIELPAYQLPKLSGTLETAWRQSWWFIKKAGTMILAVNVLLWVLMYYPAPKNPNADTAERLAGSYAARLGRLFEPVSRLAGFDWKDNIALLGGFAAKEVIVSSLATIYGIEESEEGPTTDHQPPTTDHLPPTADNRPLTTDNRPPTTDHRPLTTDLDDRGQRLVVRLRAEGNWSPLKAFALLIFVMVYAPCVATCAVIWQETGTIKYMLLAMAYTTGLATILAIGIYQIGSLFGG